MLDIRQQLHHIHYQQLLYNNHCVLSAIFHLLNDGRPITQDDLEKIQKQLYPDDDEV